MADNKTILIVEDDPIVRGVISKVAERQGAAVTTACNGKEGQEAVARMAEFDIVFLDLLMPFTSGWDVLDFIKNDEKTKNTAIVIISGAPVSATEKETLSQKVTAFVDKETFNLGEFEGMVENLLNQ